MIEPIIILFMIELIAYSHFHYYCYSKKINLTHYFFIIVFVIIQY